MEFCAEHDAVKIEAIMRFQSGGKTARHKRTTTILVIALTFFFVRAPTILAADTLLVVNSALNMLTAPLWVAEERGYFHKYGLDVDTIYIPSGTLGMQALLSGETKILAADGSSVVNARLRGAPVKIFIGMVNFYPNPFFSSPEIKSYADLRGKKIAVTRDHIVRSRKRNCAKGWHESPGLWN